MEPYSMVADYVNGQNYLNIRPQYRSQEITHQNDTRIYLTGAGLYILTITWNGTAELQVETHDGANVMRTSGTIRPGPAWIPRSLSLVLPSPVAGAHQVRLRTLSNLGVFPYNAAIMVVPVPAFNGGGGGKLSKLARLVGRWGK